MSELAAALGARVRAEGPLTYEDFVEAALYDPAVGFYETVGRAGRRGSFLTSPEVGPLFGTVLARALTTWWRDLGCPDPFDVIEVGAGPGTLARSIVAATGSLPVGRAMRYTAVERSATQRASHPDTVRSAATLESEAITGVILANELLDNVPFGLMEAWRGSWFEVRIDVDGDEFVETRGAQIDDPDLPFAAVDGARYPRQRASCALVADALARVQRGHLVIVDYAATDDQFLAREWREWVRTYRDHERGVHPLREPGTQDITCEVALEQLTRHAPPSAVLDQATFLRRFGIDELVDEGRQLWQAGAVTGGLAALRGRSRVREAEALLDPHGLGGFTVVHWIR